MKTVVVPYCKNSRVTYHSQFTGLCSILLSSKHKFSFKTAVYPFRISYACKLVSTLIMLLPMDSTPGNFSRARSGNKNLHEKDFTTQICDEYKPVSNHNRNPIDWTFTEQGMDLIHGETSNSSTIDLKNLVSKP
jgi:hypothetical protein